MELFSEEELKQLSTQRQHIVEVLAICMTPVDVPILLKILHECGWAEAETKSGTLTQALAREELNALCKLGWISPSNSSMSYVVVRPQILDAVVQFSVQNGNFRKIALRVLEFEPQLDSVARDRVRGYYLGLIAKRQARLAFYDGDVASFEAASLTLRKPGYKSISLDLLEPFNAEIFAKTPLILQVHLLVRKASLAVLTARSSVDELSAFDQFVETQQMVPNDIGTWWVNLNLVRGDTKRLKQIAKSDQTWSQVAELYLQFLLGKQVPCDAALDVILKQSLQDQGPKAKAVTLPFPLCLLHFLVLLRRNDPGSRKELAIACAPVADDPSEYVEQIAAVITAAVNYSTNPSAESKASFQQLASSTLQNALPIVQAIVVHLAHWVMPDVALKSTVDKSLVAAASNYNKIGLSWFAALCEDAATLISSSTVTNELSAGQRHQQLGTFEMLRWIEPPAIWQRKLETLRKMVEGNKPAAKSGSSTASGFDERMIWELNVGGKDSKRPFLRPVIQKVSGNGWTKGRPVALERLYKNRTKPEFAFLTEQDLAVCRTITESTVSTGYYRYTETVYDFERDQALEALIGHPFVFAPEDRSQPLELTIRPPQLVIQKVNQGFRLELKPKPQVGQDLIVTEESDQQISIVRFTPQQQKLASILDGAIDCPRSSEAEVLDTAKALSTLLSVQSDIELGSSTNDGTVKTIEADARPHLRLSPFQEGLRVEFLVQPFGDSGPSFAPGQGGKSVFANLHGKSVSTRRDATREVDLARKIGAACPSLEMIEGTEVFTFELPTSESALGLLTEVEPLREQGSLVVHWPQGESLRVVGRVAPSQLRIQIKRDRAWFEATGEVVIDELLKMDLMKLIDLVSASPSRFIALDDGRFFSLTEQIRQRLGELSVYGERKGGSLRFPQIRATALSDIDQWCTLKADKHWKACWKQIEEAGDVVAEVPSTLNAELRDYQVEGFRWLCRLSHWGAGACLADDMGLGKTLQAIAMLLRRAADGPALVIAPMSVCFNWEAELRRFAPTLNPRIFGGGDRNAFIAELGPRDVVITSYGLLHTEIERLQSVQWHTAILDEAQAIKNTFTKRSQAAMSLKANFRLILTGTPIENRLGELWNLFQFINPGLLGSIEQYHQRFAIPIERDHNRDASQQLKRLIQPFLLRRTKSQVLSELPPRIEVTVPVTLSDEESVLYEAARQRAIVMLSEDVNAQGRHVRILAEIMRLRRACCHPNLLLPDCGLQGSKLAAFSETIDELLANKHKALVFSQFVDHLSILRAELDRKGIAYQYLDGSTSMKARKQSVEAFQNGEGDIFLISLKAGGTGLNLTAADYVLHMDPWWNPAVEDQASDRAHRLGQRRPVTIYRFITRGTIEERILDLHSTKRELADSLLEGSESTGRLSAEELLALIR